MKILFIEAGKKIKESNISKIEKIPGKIHLLYTIQYKKLAEKIKSKLRNRVIDIEQVLGCSKIKPKASLLLIGSGRFHALQLALTTNKKVYIYEQGKISKIEDREIEEKKEEEKAKLSRFYSSNNIGLIFSSKTGQNRIQEVKIFQQLEKIFKGKKFYLFVFDTLNIQELENFQIEFWINTACPGLELDSNKIINYENLKVHHQF